MLGEAVSAAATRTMRGGAQVELRVQTSVPDVEALSEYAGVVASTAIAVVLTARGTPPVRPRWSRSFLTARQPIRASPTHKWVFARGAEGTRGMFHPSGLLDALARSQTSAVEVGERWVELGLDHDVLDASADAGLAPDWQSTAVARISPSGGISNIALTHRSCEDPDSLMRVECAISELLQVSGIDLPPPETTISLATKIEQEHDQADT